MIISGQNFNGKVGEFFSATPAASGSPALWRSTGLPPGLSLNSTTGQISGTPEKFGSFTPVFSDKPFATGVLTGGSYSDQGYYYHAIKSDGTVIGWGGTVGASVPSGLTDVVEIVGGLALKRDGTVVGIGYGVAPIGLSNVAALGRNLVLKKDGTLFAWGDNSYGQTNVPAGSDFVAVASGNRWHVALKANGTLAAWGESNSGLLNTADITGVTAIAAGTNFYLTLHEDGTVFSRAGSNNPDDIWSYGSSATDPRAVAISAGGNRSLVLLENKTVYRYGDVGYPATFGIVPNLNNVVAIGANSSFSAVKTDGSIVKWGESLSQNSPVVVTGLTASTITRKGETAEFTISEGVPSIISEQTLSGKVARPFESSPGQAEYIPALNDPENRPVTLWSITGLPAGLSLNTSSGAITGLPEDSGSTQITITATGPGGSDTKTATVAISIGAPSITFFQGFTGKVGEFFTQAIQLDDDADRPATSWSATSLPSGLSINNSTGLVTGVPSILGQSYGYISASGPGGNSAPRQVTFTITEGVPIITAGQTASGMAGIYFSKFFSLTDSANRPVTSWAATGLPDGLIINATTGQITGSATTAGTYETTLTATGPGGTDSEAVSILISAAIPFFLGSLKTAAVYAGTTEGQAVYYGPQLLWNVLGWEPPNFSPASISGLRLWLDSSLGLYDATTGGNLVTTNSSPVRRWEDRSGNGFHATGGSSTSPTMATAQVNNHAALSFSGSGFLDLANPLASGGTGASIFVVVRPSMTGADSGPLVGMIGNNTSEYWRDSHYPYQNTKIEDGFAATTRKTITAPAGLGNWHLYTVISQNSNWRYFFNGSVHFSTTSNTYNGDNFSGRTPQIGRSSIQGTWLYRGWIAEILIYNTALSESDRLAVSEYLRAKYTLY